MSGTLTPQGAAISKNIAMSIKHKIKYDGSELSRISIAQRAAISCQDLIRNTGEPVGDCHKYLEDAFKAECTDSTKYSKDECGDIIKNGFWQLCQGFRSFYKECKDFKFKSMGGIDTSAGWLWGIGGLLIGGIVAAMVWVLVYCVFLRKKGPKVSKGPSHNLSSTSTSSLPDPPLPIRQFQGHHLDGSRWNLGSRGPIECHKGLKRDNDDWRNRDATQTSQPLNQSSPLSASCLHHWSTTSWIRWIFRNPQSSLPCREDRRTPLEHSHYLNYNFMESMDLPDHQEHQEHADNLFNNRNNDNFMDSPDLYMHQEQQKHVDKSLNFHQRQKQPLEQQI